MQPSTSDERRDPKTCAIIGAAMEVHRQLGSGFHESVYQEALAIEFALRGIPFRAQVEVSVHYKGRRLEAAYKPDFICYGDIVVELKALAKLSTTEQAQVINYLNATGYEVGLLLNFGSRSLEHPRFVRSVSGIPGNSRSEDLESA